MRWKIARSRGCKNCVKLISLWPETALAGERLGIGHAAA
jgi:hypothetical protein